MARRPHVPKFGQWDANDHMPYTAVFDHARTGRGKPINPNDPSENPDMFGGGKGNGAAPGRRFNPNDPEDLDAADLHQERPGPGNRDTGNSRGQQHQAVTAPPKTVQESPARRQVAATPPQNEGRNSPMPNRPPPGDHMKRQGNRDSGITDRSSDSASTSFTEDQSHQSHNRKSNPGTLGGASGGAPGTAWDSSKRKQSGNFKPEDSAQKGSAALPKFGAWNAQDPGSGEGFTVIFNQARNERKAGGPGRIPLPNEAPNQGDLYIQPHRLQQRNNNKRWFCCFERPAVNA